MTKKQLDAKIRQRWPGIGEALRANMVDKLWKAPNFVSGGVKLTDFCFSEPDEHYSSEHLLSVLWRYAAQG
jgi:hypothetical protein